MSSGEVRESSARPRPRRTVAELARAMPRVFGVVIAIGVLLLGEARLRAEQSGEPVRASESAAADSSSLEIDEHARAWAQQFFAGCPRRPRLRVHRDTNLLDPHALFYTASGIMELEFIRMADWFVDAIVPGSREVRPFERTANGVRIGYQHLGHSRPVERFAELVDALQIRELSLGDVTATHNVVGGSTGGSLGSGTLVRVNKLVNWMQHVTGDLNEGIGILIRRPRGLVTWQGPTWAVDRVQTGVSMVFHGAGVLVARGIDRGLTGMEGGTEAVVNIGRAVPHEQTTVFLRMPVDVYRADALWAPRHRGRVYVGTAQELAGLSHAAIFHGRGRLRGVRWWDLSRLKPEPSHVIIITDESTMARAPDSWRAYVIPADRAMQSQPSEIEH